MQTQSYDLEGLAQANVVLTRSNSEVMAQFSHMNVTMNYMQAQINFFSLTTTNQTTNQREYYC